MPWLLLIVTHLFVLGVGVAVGRWLVLRTLTVFEHDGHPALELRHDDPEGGE